mmetsp:Transcript_13824/g.32601  ORF Transcript_13824/g.32601 Transcript_13824/m.32601 type:complete len:223 (+) Transcript_13824:968-1636(+)
MRVVNSAAVVPETVAAASLAASVAVLPRSFEAGIATTKFTSTSLLLLVRCRKCPAAADSESIWANLRKMVSSTRTKPTGRPRKSATARRSACTAAASEAKSAPLLTVMRTTKRTSAKTGTGVLDVVMVLRLLELEVELSEVLVELSLLKVLPVEVDDVVAVEPLDTDDLVEVVWVVDEAVVEDDDTVDPLLPEDPEDALDVEVVVDVFTMITGSSTAVTVNC